MIHTSSQKKKTIHQRCTFGQRFQVEGEPSEAYVRALHVMAERCDYGQNKDTYIRDRIVSGILDKDMLRGLQMEENLTLATAANKVRTKELILAQQREDNQVAPRTEVYYVKYKDSKRSAGANVYSRGRADHNRVALEAPPRGLRGTSMHLKTFDTAEQAMSLECVLTKPVTCVGNGTISPKSAIANK